MNIHRETIHNIHEKYPLWKKAIELDYELLGLADDVFISSVKYYFSPEGFGIILSRDVFIILGKDTNAVKKEALRLEKKVNRTPK